MKRYSSVRTSEASQRERPFFLSLLFLCWLCRFVKVFFFFFRLFRGWFLGLPTLIETDIFVIQRLYVACGILFIWNRFGALRTYCLPLRRITSRSLCLKITFCLCCCYLRWFMHFTLYSGDCKKILNWICINWWI